MRSANYNGAEYPDCFPFIEANQFDDETEEWGVTVGEFLVGVVVLCSLLVGYSWVYQWAYDHLHPKQEEYVGYSSGTFQPYSNGGWVIVGPGGSNAGSSTITIGHLCSWDEDQHEYDLIISEGLKRNLIAEFNHDECTITWKHII